ncbi:feruloyl-CoA synthase [Phenylobacterium sp. J367]|uniref:feruloyl-CoA synthase n=1 Tax=Phenylobacterium sp. J367 TaxID=2898435 RepID=UPI0021513376|nr:feruloyl-CoA synthase [Phenylobacterium sp. J367]MCR5877433.1 feruloyl-CoA synthase [Phenylobacterium sp. J367]
MDAELRTDTAPFRDPLYAPRRLDVDARPGGELVLTNSTPYSERFQTLWEALDFWAAAAPERTWLAERSGEGWRTLTFREARERIAALAAGLRDLGVVGERPLLILSGNAIDHALIKYAAMSQGMPAAPVSAQYGLAGANLARLTHAVEILKPAAVYTEDAALFAHGLSADCLAGLPVIAGANPRPGDVPLDSLYRAGTAAFTARPEDHAKYLLTSGSTGHPKAVICTHRATSLNAAQIEACFADPDPPVMLHSAPWSHSLGANAILHMGLHRGGTLYIDRGQPTAARFGETLRNLHEVAPTYQNMVPAGWMLLVDALERDDALARTFFSRVRLLQYGGAALGQATADRIQAVAVRTVGERISFGSGYGATETGPTACNVHWPNARMGMIGLPIPGTSVRLMPNAGKLEFRVKGPQITQGYLGRPDLNAQIFDDEGFYVIGDAARLVDPSDPRQGMVYDGRLSENFKLVSGAFVSVGDLRIGAVGAIGGAVTDAVVCGEGHDSVGLLLYPNPTLPRGEVEAAVRAGLDRFNSRGLGSSGKVARAILLESPPDPHSGEITDKGYIAQSLARTKHGEAVRRLFADPPSPDVMVFE